MTNDRFNGSSETGRRAPHRTGSGCPGDGFPARLAGQTGRAAQSEFPPFDLV